MTNKLRIGILGGTAVAAVAVAVIAMREPLQAQPKPAPAAAPDQPIAAKPAPIAMFGGDFTRNMGNFTAKDIPAAKELIKVGLERAAELKGGKSGWLAGSGPRGYVSKIDGSVQPYGLFVPASYKPDHKHRLDFWLHGRDESLTELHFVNGRLKALRQNYLRRQAMLERIGTGDGSLILAAGR